MVFPMAFKLLDQRTDEFVAFRKSISIDRVMIKIFVVLFFLFLAKQKSNTKKKEFPLKTNPFSSIKITKTNGSPNKILRVHGSQK